MKLRQIRLDPIARRDLKEIWLLIAKRDGAERANSVVTRVRAFCLSLHEFAAIGSRHDDCRPGLRSAGIPGLKSAAVLFKVSDDSVTIVRVGYLGRNIWDTTGQLIDG